MCRELHARKLEAIAVGSYTVSQTTLELLFDWADKIIIMDHGVTYVPEENLHKVVKDFIVGRDRWSNPYHPELASILRSKADTYFGATRQ